MDTGLRVTELAYWIRSREAIRLLKEAGVPPPWSKDPAMTTVRYCNIRREDDKVTKWIKDNWRDQNVDHPNLTAAMVLARMVNWPDTLAEIGFPDKWDRKHIIDVIKARAAREEKTWSSAYMITTCGKRMAKEDYVLDVCDTALRFVPRFEDGTSLDSAHTSLSSISGLGSFLAGQVVADLKNIPGHPLAAAEDWWTWCAPGPGSRKGLNEFFNFAPDRAMSDYAFDEMVRTCYMAVAPEIEPYVERLHMQDFQNCLCEFSKFMRVKRGGHARNRYVAR